MPEREFTCATFGGSRTYGLLGRAGSEITVSIAIEGDNDKIDHRHQDASPSRESTDRRDRLRSLRGPGDSFSDVILALAK
jgi:hypothetical protein